MEKPPDSSSCSQCWRAFGCAMVRSLPQSLQIVELDVPAFTADEPVILEPGKYPAYSLFRYTQIISDIASGHAQVELGRRAIAFGKLLRQAEQKGSKPLFRVMFSKQQQQFLTVPEIGRAHV